MSRKMLGREIVTALNATGMDWRIENGKSHTKIMVGKGLVTTLPRSQRKLNATPRDLTNTLLHIRRFADKQREA